MHRKQIAVTVLILFALLVVTSVYAKMPTLGVCYYPEQWPAQLWESDAQRMKELGIEYVRVGEFMWSTLEPRPNQFNWTVLDATLEILGRAGLKVIIGTPTATPPKWLIDKYGGDDLHSQILPWDLHGKARKFGSRRHYRFSSSVYRKEVVRITDELLQRYSRHPAVGGWQLDNEYGCHDTVRSYDTMDSLPRFRNWLQKRYNQSVSVLNKAWGNTFWSMEYNDFSAIDLPNLAVTEANPAHRLDFYRYSSDEVLEFNKLTYELVKSKIPAANHTFITSNFMGFFMDFDHFGLGEHLDIASWDSYPLGFTEEHGHLFSPDDQIRFAQTGHPDVASFNHDLYSSVTGHGLERKHFIVMEQQPGPVNWAFYNPSPAPGMIRLWTWEAIAHGASMVSYFRWRQAKFAQEQMHAGLNRPDNIPDVAYYEIKQVKLELDKLASLLDSPLPSKASVALVFDYQTQWVSQVQPQGQQFSYIKLVYMFYSEVRKFGLDVDILKPGADLDGYKLIIVPSLSIVSEAARKSFESVIASRSGQIVFGPRTGSKTESTFQIPDSLPPGILQQEVLPGLRVTRVETFAPGAPRNASVNIGEQDFSYSVWKEWLEIDSSHADQYRITANFSTLDRVERPAAVVHKTNLVHYLAVFPTQQLLEHYMRYVVFEGQLKGLPFDGIRVCRARDNLFFAFNFDNVSHELKDIVPSDATLILGSADSIGPHDVVAWTTK